MNGQLPLDLTKNPENQQLVDKLASLEAYDFTPARESLLAREEWTTDEYREAELGAKRFFALRFLDPDHEHVPYPKADQLWHQMILNTAWYRRFCDEVFGFYLDHDPWVGPETERQQQLRTRSADVYVHWFKDGQKYMESLKFSPGPVPGICGSCHVPEKKFPKHLRPAQATMFKG